MDEQRTGKQVNAETSAEGRATFSVTATLRLWQARYEYLLDSAKQLRADGHHAAAIVTAQSACEACMELVLTEAVRGRVGDAAIANFITDSLHNYNPINGRVLKLYKLLFGHSLQENQPFWSDFNDYVERRNKIVHHGHLATAEGADKSIATVEKVIDHLLQNRP